LQVEPLEERALLAVVSWDGGGGDLQWANPLNWSTDAIPVSGDDVSIDVPGNITVSLDTNDVEIRSLTSHEGLLLRRNLTVLGNSVIGGPLVITNTRTLEARGASTHLTLSGQPDLRFGNLLATSGAVIEASNLSSFTSQLINDFQEFRAEGNGSRIDLSQLTNTFTGASHVGRVRVSAVNGGVVDLSGITAAEGGIEFLASGAGSTIVVPNLARTDGVDPFSNDHLTFTVNGPTASLPLPALTTLVRTSLVATNGGELTLPAITSYQGGNNDSHTIRAEGTFGGSPSTIDLSHLTSTLIGSSHVGRVRISAVSGGQIDLSGITVAEGGLEFAASGAASAISVPNLASTDGIDAFSNEQLVFTVDGPTASIPLPALTTLVRTSLVATNGGQLTLPAITSYQGGYNDSQSIRAEGNLSRIDLSHLTNPLIGAGHVGRVRVSAVSGGQIDLSGIPAAEGGIEFLASGAASSILVPNLASTDGFNTFTNDQIVFAVDGPTAFIPLPSLTTLVRTSLVATAGGQLTLPAITSYQGGVNENQMIRADGSSGGNPSTIDLSHLTATFIGGGHVGRVFVSAASGGRVDLSGITAAESGIEFLASGNGSTILVPNLSRTDGRDLSSNNQLVFTVDGPAASIPLPALTTLVRTGLVATAGGQLTLPAITSYQGGSNDNQMIRAEGASGGTPSTIDLSHLTTTFIGGGNVGRVFVSAENGGKVDLSGISNIERGVHLLASGAGSTILVPNLLSTDGRNPSSNNQIFITVDGPTASIPLPALTTVVRTSLAATAGGQLTLPAIISYRGGENDSQQIRAAGASSRVDLSHLAAPLIGSGNAGRLELVAESGGVIDLSNASSLTARVDMTVGNGSIIDIRSASQAALLSLTTSSGATIFLSPAGTRIANISFRAGDGVAYHGALEIAGTGDLTGSGIFSVDKLINSALVSPRGTLPGKITLAGGYEQKSSGQLRLDLNGLIPETEHDQLEINGSAIFGGTLTVAASGFTPSLLNVFDVAFYTGHSGTFATKTGLDLGGGVVLDTLFLPTKLQLRVSEGLIVVAGGPYSVAEGADTLLEGASSGSLAAIYTWDLDGDGNFGETGAAASFGDETGASPTFSALTLDGPVNRTVTLRVVDGGESATSTAIVAVTNVAPAVDAGGPYAALPGAPVVLNGATFTDACAADSLTIAWDLDGDGVFGETGPGALQGNETGAAPTFIGAGNGTSATVTLRVTDDDGGAEVDTAIVDLTIRRFDFNHDFTPSQPGSGTPSPTQAGYLSVLPRDAYLASRGYGWLNTPSSIDRGAISGSALSEVLRDGHFFTRNASNNFGARTFSVALAAGEYWVSVTAGDKIVTHDLVQVNAEGGTAELTGISTSLGQFAVRGFSVAVSDGRLDLEFTDQGGTNADWVINGVVIRPWSVAQSSLAIAGPGVPLSGDGVTLSTFSGSGATPSTLITVATSMGTVVGADASSLYQGFQVQADGSGQFAIVIQAPPSVGTATITAEALEGVGRATLLQNYGLATLRRFDFNASSTAGGNNITAPGYISVLASNVYSSTTGFGWLSNFGFGEFERNTPAAALTSPLRRDGHFGSGVGGRTFQIDVKPGVQYNVRVYVGDYLIARSNIQVTVEGTTLYTIPPLAAGTFDTTVRTTSLAASSNGVLTINIRHATGGTWVANGIDIWEVGSSDPAAAMLQATQDSQIGNGADTRLTAEKLAPIISEAIDRWTATGLSPSQIAAMRMVDFHVVDLSHSRELGNAQPGKIEIDDNAAGYGWFIDLSPDDDNEFSLDVIADERLATSGSPAASRMDLLTVVMHELGHTLGFEDLAPEDAASALMTAEISVGIRRTPGQRNELSFPFFQEFNSQQVSRETLYQRTSDTARVGTVTGIATILDPPSRGRILSTDRFLRSQLTSPAIKTGSVLEVRPEEYRSKP